MKKTTCNGCLYYDSCSHDGLCEHFYDASQDDQMAEEYIEGIKDEFASLWRVYSMEYND